MCAYIKMFFPFTRTLFIRDKKGHNNPLSDNRNETFYNIKQIFMVKPKTVISQYAARNRRLKKVGITYKEYLLSTEWKKVRDYLVTQPLFQECFCCRYKGNLDMHHMTYRYMFHKSMKLQMQFIKPLCRACHKRVHELTQEKGWGLRQAVRRLKKEYNV